MRRSKRSGSGSPPEPGTTEIRVWPNQLRPVRWVGASGSVCVGLGLGGSTGEARYPRQAAISGSGEKEEASPGTRPDLAAVPAPNADEAASCCPAANWYPMLDRRCKVEELGVNLPIATGNLFDGFHPPPTAVTQRSGCPIRWASAPRGGRPHRRPGCRPDGPRALVHERRPGVLADGGWQGREAARGAHAYRDQIPCPLILRQPLLRR